MSLRVRIVLILVGVLGFYGILSYVVQRAIIFPSFVSLERTEARQNMKRCVAAINREVHHLDVLADDWSAWDDTYQFVVDHNEDYIASNLVQQTFHDNQLTALFILDLEDNVVWGGARDFETGLPITIKELPRLQWPTDHPLLRNVGTDASIAAGILLTSRGPMLVAARAIRTSANAGPFRGILVMGRLLTPKNVEELAEQTRVRFQIWPLTTENILPPDLAAMADLARLKNTVFGNADEPGMLSIYKVMPDLQGVPALLLRADLPRVITAKGRVATHYALFSLAASGIIVLLVLLALLQYNVTGPVSRLTAHAVAVGKSDDLSAHLAMKRSDEIGTLAAAFDRMLTRLAKAQSELVSRSYESGRAEMAAGVLHNVRNALTPLVAEIDLLRNAIDDMPVENAHRAIDELAHADLSETRRKDLLQLLSLSVAAVSEFAATARNHLAAIQTRSVQVEEILDKQDDFSHTERPTERVRLDGLIREAIELLPPQKAQGIRFEIAPELGEIGQVKTCRLVVLQVLANVFTNAAESIKRAGRTNGSIRIEGASEEIDGIPTIHLRIIDNGEGMTPDELAQLFQRGVSLKPGGRSGLGLHWCANTLNAMSGRIFAESPGENQGATFHVQFPHSA